MKKISLILSVFLIASSCSSTPAKPDRNFSLSHSGAKQSFATWLDGGEVVPSNTDSPELLFVEAEALYYKGFSNQAFDRYVRLLKLDSASPLARLCAWRIHELRDEIPDYHFRLQTHIAEVDFGKMSPLTKASWQAAIQVVKLRAWKDSESSEPFNSSAVGVPTHWTHTPRMSPWRLRDFDVVFPPESSSSFKEEYVSPSDANDVPRNRKKIKASWAFGISISPGLGQSGIYYLESFAQLDKSAKIWLDTSFSGASKIWIDGELLVTRREGDYKSGERFRHIELSAGTHRILVKMAYQSGYRDWFDLSFIPEKQIENPIRFEARCIPSQKLQGCLVDPEVDGSVSLLSETLYPQRLESLYLHTEDIPKASDFMLYVTMLESVIDGDSEIFEEAWKVLEKRNPKFAAGYWIEHDYISWQWDIPSEVRGVESLKALKSAYELDPNFRFSIALEKLIGKNKTDTERKAMLKPAYDDAVKNGVSNLQNAKAWPGFLAKREWSIEEEFAIEKLLTDEAGSCAQANRLIKLKERRDIYWDLSHFGDWVSRCQNVQGTLRSRHKSGSSERISYYKQQIGRYPLSVSSRKKLVFQLQRAGKPNESLLDEAAEIRPSWSYYWSKKINEARDAGDSKAAIKLLDQYEKEYGVKSWTIWKRSGINKTIPMQDLLKDGKVAAMAAVNDKNNAKLSKDDRYFVIDFAARRYFEDGSHLTLTHTLTRLMTKKAIDDSAEQSLPANARILRVQTIKQNGEIRIPETTAGKDTLSMPGLAEGDFVEIAYLEFSGAPSIGSAVDGIRFFFQMASISTLKSEYVIIGDEGSFRLENNPPKLERFKYHGLDAIRFASKNNPAPRSEPASVPSDEYLPWVQMYRNPYKISDFEVSRRFRYEQIRDALKRSSILKKSFKGLLSQELGKDEFIKKAFYEVAHAIKSPRPSSVATEVSHALLSEDGNPTLVLKALFDEHGVESELFVARSQLAVEEQLPTGEFSNFGTIFLRAQKSDGSYVWLFPVGLDAMYGAVDSYSLGEKAVCISCAEEQWDRLPDEVEHQNKTQTKITGKVDEKGTLHATILLSIDGTRAVNIRSSLRNRPDDNAREQFMGALANGMIPGSTVRKSEIINEKNPDVAIQFRVEIERPKYMIQAQGGWLLETHIFHAPLESQYASLASRTLPLFLRYPTNNEATFELQMSFDTVELVSQSGDYDLKSEFGDVLRSVTLDGKTIRIASKIKTGIQRISVDRYLEFQKWARKVQQSSTLVVRGK